MSIFAFAPVYYKMLHKSIIFNKFGKNIDMQWVIL